MGGRTRFFSPPFLSLWRKKGRREDHFLTCSSRLRFVKAFHPHFSRWPSSFFFFFSFSFFLNVESLLYVSSRLRRAISGLCAAFFMKKFQPSIRLACRCLQNSFAAYIFSSIFRPLRASCSSRNGTHPIRKLKVYLLHNQVSSARV